MATDEDYRALMRSLQRAALLSDRVGERLLSRRIGVGRAMFLVLRTIEESEGAVSQQAIADSLSLTKGAVSRHVAAAEQNGWLTVAASPLSRREHALALTAAGRVLVADGRAVQAEYQAELAHDDRVGPADVAAAARVLAVICERLEQEDRA
jgi:MarR family transcriptional regulator, organic hydroperoxide resistance regulator